MSKREPLLNNDRLVNLCEDGQLYPWQREAQKVRDIYESARAKDAELIQQLVDALVEQKKWLTWIPLHHMDDADQSECIADGKRSDNALSTAAAQGFTTTPEP